MDDENKSVTQIDQQQATKRLTNPWETTDDQTPQATLRQNDDEQLDEIANDEDKENQDITENGVLKTQRPTIVVARLKRLMNAAFPGKTMNREVLELLGALTLRMTEEMAAGILLQKCIETGDPREKMERTLRLTREDGLEFLRRNEGRPPWSGLCLASEWFTRGFKEGDVNNSDAPEKLTGRKRAVPEDDGRQQRLTSFFSKLPRVDEPPGVFLPEK